MSSTDKIEEFNGTDGRTWKLDMLSLLAEKDVNASLLAGLPSEYGRAKQLIKAEERMIDVQGKAKEFSIVEMMARLQEEKADNAPKKRGTSSGKVACALTLGNKATFALAHGRVL